MYEDVSAVTKVSFNNANFAYSVLTSHVLSGMEDKSRAPVHYRAKYRAEPLKDTSIFIGRLRFRLQPVQSHIFIWIA